ncbi:MAG: alpha,alpha-trehalose-phosphate synthase (UDP-forming) [Mycobacteriales bacterium]|nr:MAG: trehalose-6-phosphate synthase [Pseudonocardiales bacterium]
MSTKRSLLVVSNRGPVSIDTDDSGSDVARRGSGGLVSALQSALTDDGLWICSAMGDRERAIARRCGTGTLHGSGIDTGELAVRMLAVDAQTFNRAYNGIANSTLWFVNHMLYDIPRSPVFDGGWRRQWGSYERFNALFADAVTESAAEGATVMVQDYHLFLVPRMLRERRPDLSIGHFTHTPWANPDYFAMLPDDVAASILTGLLGADHVGFHGRRWADSFVDCCVRVLGAEVDDARTTVTAGGLTARVGVHPLGSDADALRERASRADVERELHDLREVIGDRLVISRVDRTELSKNILRGLQSYRELLRTRPKWRNRVVHVAFAYPSRHELPEYREYTASIERLGHEIDDEFGTDDWTPLVLEVGHNYAGSLAALRASDVMLINPVRDGMNLVAQEGCILSEHGCALVLSREAGAAELFGDDALLANPYDVSGTATALDEALSMSADARRDRCGRLVSAATASPPAEWFAEQLSAVRREHQP